MTPYHVEKFKNKLYEDINNSNITISEAYYVVKEVFEKFQLQYFDLAKNEPDEPEKFENVDINDLPNSTKEEYVGEQVMEKI